MRMESNIHPNDQIYRATGKDKKFYITDANVAEHTDRMCKQLQKNVEAAGANGVVIGMSGGLDSAVAGALAHRAGVPVYSILMPYGDTMKQSGSMSRAEEMNKKFGFESEIIDIEPMCQSLRAANGSPLRTEASEKDSAYADMNMRALVRMLLSRERARLKNYLFIDTSNLSEYMVGYFTKGAVCGDLQPTLMLTKREMRVLARFLGVPESILDAVPSAELHIGQTDESELGFTYDQLDDWILQGASGDEAVDEKIYRLAMTTQHKRISPPAYMG